MLSVERLPEGFGARVLGLDLSVALEESDVVQVRDALYRHQVVVIPEQTIEPGRFIEFSRHFGRAVPHVLSHMRLAGYPEILPLSNIFESGEPSGIYDGAVFWHTDMSYEDPPGAATLVYSIKAPETGGDTRFADMYRAYDTLNEATKRRIDDLVVLHHYGNRADLKDSSRTSAFALTEEQRNSVQNVYHPLVRKHPSTGRKALYGVAGSSFGIAGIQEADALLLLDELKTHATRDELVYQHHYAVGDVVIWDNYSTLHSATLMPPATSPATERYLYRISVKERVVD